VAEPESTDPRGASPPWPFARADRPRTKWAHHEETRPIVSDSGHDAEASTGHRRIRADADGKSAVVLLVDDDARIRRSVGAGLRLEGFEVVPASGGRAALAAVEQIDPAVMLLDMAMPDLDGLEVLKRLRAAGHDMPVCVLSARDEIGDRVAGLEAGADDYVVKPFALEEVVARLHALLRRRPPRSDGIFAVGDIELDEAGHRALRAGRDLELTRRELELLSLFMRHPGEVISRERLHEEVWGYDFDPKTNVADVFVGYLRRKLEAGDAPRVLHTVRGVGFVLRP
jgi:DNA-binding response OmpR family regulator